MASFRVTGRGERVVHDEIDEEGRAWKASVERLVSVGAIPNPEKFTIAELVDGEPGRITNWRPRRIPVAQLERTGT